MKYYSAIKKDEIVSFPATQMDLKIILSKVSQKEKDKYRIISFIWGISNMTQMNLSTKQKQSQRHREQTCGCLGERVVEEGLEETNWEFRVTRHELLNREWINKVLL